MDLSFDGLALFHTISNPPRDQPEYVASAKAKEQENKQRHSSISQSPLAKARHMANPRAEWEEPTVPQSKGQGGH